MRSLSACYNEHAIKVSDSYCWGPSRQSYQSPISSSYMPCSVSCVYRTKVTSPMQRTFFITLTWLDHLAGHGLNLSVAETPLDSKQYRLAKKRGDKVFQFVEAEIRVSWDLCSALFLNGPQPRTGFYVDVWVDSELCLYVGDKAVDDDGTEKTRNEEAKGWMTGRSERYSGNWSVYRTNARLTKTGEAHEIEINGDGVWIDGGALSVSIDRKRAVEVKRLRWNFRGNETIFIDGVVVDLMWDLYGWFFRPAAAAIFLFRARPSNDFRLWLDPSGIDEDESYNFSLFISASNPIQT